MEQRPSQRRAYAPELDIRGTVATGTPYFSPETRAAWRAAHSPDAVDRTLGFSFLILSLVEQIDPGFSVRDYVTDAALPVVIAASKSCYGDIARQIVAAKLTHDLAFKYPGAPVFAKAFQLMGYPTLAIKTPVFLGTGGKDHEVPPDVQMHLGADACAHGSTIEQHVYPDLDHSGTVNGSTADSVVFVRKAFAGERITGNCRARPSL